MSETLDYLNALEGSYPTRMDTSGLELKDYQGFPAQTRERVGFIEGAAAEVDVEPIEERRVVDDKA